MLHSSIVSNIDYFSVTPLEYVTRIRHDLQIFLLQGYQKESIRIPIRQYPPISVSKFIENE